MCFHRGCASVRSPQGSQCAEDPGGHRARALDERHSSTSPAAYLSPNYACGHMPGNKDVFPITSLPCSKIRHRLQGRLHFLLLFRGPLRPQPLHSQCLPPATKNETQIRISSQMPWSDPFWWVDESDLTRQPDIHGLRAPPQSPLKWREASVDEIEAGQKVR